MNGVISLFTEDLYGILYEDLPCESGNGADIFFSVVDCFEQNIEQFAKYISTLTPFIKLPEETAKATNDTISELFCCFIKWLCKLPEPFIPHNLMQLYLENPNITAAQQTIAALQQNKRQVFNRFIKLLRKANNLFIFPVSYDQILGPAFAHQTTSFLFSFLVKESCSALLFPFQSIKSFLKEELNFYPEIDTDDIIDYTAIRSQVTPEMLIAPTTTIAEQLAQLYNDTKLKARALGLSDDIISKADKIPSSDAVKYKTELKSLLMEFENKMQEITGRKPTKGDKTPLTTLYKLHMDLRKRCRSKSHVDDLRAEKHALQKELNEFRVEFENKYGRPISNAADKASVASKYARYKAVKNELSMIESETSK